MSAHGDDARGVDSETAWTRSISSSACVWDPPMDSPNFRGSVRGRLAAGFATPVLTPKFGVSRDDTFFCIGSCFARVIERELRYRNLEIASLQYHGELAEQKLGPNGANKFTTASILNELRWALDGVAFPEASLVPDGDGYRDLQLAAAAAPVSLERARERRAELKEYFGRLRRADVVIITLGLVELWYDHQTQLWLNITPPLEVTRRFPGRFTVHAGAYADNRARLEDVLDMLAAYGPPGQRTIVTVSPVPMHRTFLEPDVLAANVYGKSTLRAVAGDVARARANVEYWPAYEAVTVTGRERAYAPDQSHVTEQMGEELVRSFAAAFGLRDDRQASDFREKDYLRANPDVRIAVTEGRIASGYDHWVSFGRAEGRPLRAFA